MRRRSSSVDGNLEPLLNRRRHTTQGPHVTKICQGASGSVCECQGTSRSACERLGAPCERLRMSRSVRERWGASARTWAVSSVSVCERPGTNVWGRLRAPKSVCECPGASASAGNHLGAPRNVWEHLGASASAQEDFGASASVRKRPAGVYEMSGSVCERLGKSTLESWGATANAGEHSRSELFRTGLEGRAKSEANGHA